MIIAEHNAGHIHPVAYELLGRARSLIGDSGEQVLAAIAGPQELDLRPLVERGADRVYHLQGTVFNHPLEMAYRDALVPLLQEIKPGIVLIGATAFGRSLAPRLAAALDTGLTADCTDLELDPAGDLIQIRPAFTENILAHIITSTRPQMATIRYREFPAPEPDPGRQGEIIVREPELQRPQPVWINKKTAAAGVNIAAAEVIVAGGRGVKKAGDFELLQELASLLGGTVGATRDVVEAGLISRDYQVGYSGQRVRPRLYIACGISGAPQHLAGMKEAEIIMAINTDPSAPIMDLADIGITGDWYRVVPRLIEKIKEQQ